MYMPITLEMVIIGNVLGVIIGIFTGAIGAVHRNRPADYGVKTAYLVTWASPPFLIAFGLQLFLGYYLRLLPPYGLVDPSLTAPPSSTPFPLLNALVAGDYPYLISLLQHMVLPSLTIAIIGFGIVTRLTRSSMLETLGKDYVKLAYAEGMENRKVVYGTALRNASIPIITLIALIFAFSMSGAILVEEIFQYHGMGYFIYQAVLSLDYVAILAFTIIIGISVIVANLLADILYAVADPRVRLE